MKKISLNDIRIDGGTQGRSVIDQPTVYLYVENMKEGDEFPPLETYFDGVTHWLVDGFHRYHAYKVIGAKSVSVNYKPGTLEEAQVAAFGVNAQHGKPRTNEDKRKIVQDALVHPLTKDKSNYEIAKICKVSQPFVAGIRDPQVKKKQDENIERHIKKKAEHKLISSPEELTQNTNSISNGPDQDELEANNLTMEADLDFMYKLLESDDALATAHEEIQRLNHLNSQLEIRLNGLMGERNEAVKMVKKLQKEVDTLKAKK
ncbi:hypothetical protein UFOVP239_42 [uncultured Caudovirales phage]|uniref:ParB/Sulfiredoxin n=1 Tax=uncultured Caudovirales phage TaxID=2100421 RepID=A0A6J7WTN2_9CAUD|nr:hypothetical protein UFOVP239_42 [uncultured Caudovirales phage]